MSRILEKLPVKREPDFERLRTTLYRGQADAVPLIELGIHPIIKEQVLGRPVVTVADDIEFMSGLGYDFIKLQPRFALELGRAKAKGKEAGSADGVDRVWASEHGGVIQTMEDFEKYNWPKVEDIDYSAFEEAARILPDGMKVIGQYGDIFTNTWEMMGFENFSIAIYEEPELIDAIMGKVGELVLSMFRNMVSFDSVGAVWYSDDIAYTSGLMVSPTFLRGSFFPLLKQIGDLAGNHDMPFLYHTDGVLWEVYDDIVSCGVEAHHPIEPLAMDINEVKQRMGDRLCLCGNIDVDILSRGSIDEVQKLVRKRIEEVAPGGGYCLGSSNSVPDYARVENYLAMVKTALEVGRY